MERSGGENPIWSRSELSISIPYPNQTAKHLYQPWWDLAAMCAVRGSKEDCIFKTWNQTGTSARPWKINFGVARKFARLVEPSSTSTITVALSSGIPWLCLQRRYADIVRVSTARVRTRWSTCQRNIDSRLNSPMEVRHRLLARHFVLNQIGN